jgi:hypothetical protein
MEILAAAQTQTSPFQSAPTQTAPAYQNTMVQPDRPVYRPTLAAKALSYGLLVGNVCILIFVVVMLYRFVRATEKIADKIEKGIIVRKEDTTTQSQS